MPHDFPILLRNDICPYAANGACEGYKDSEASRRCVEPHYEGCELYKDFGNNIEIMFGAIRTNRKTDDREFWEDL